MLLSAKKPAKIAEELLPIFRRFFFTSFFTIIFLLNVAVAEERSVDWHDSSFIKNTQGTLVEVDKPIMVSTSIIWILD